MADATPRGEMPFLDHLEELRWRLLKSLLAIALGSAAGWFVVQRFDIIGILKRPIAPLLPDGRLVFTSPAEPLMITLKFAFFVGLLLASPVVIYQIWAFLAPALYEREKRLIVPALSVGVVLFLIGAAACYLWVLPAALEVLFGFQRNDLAPFITVDRYFSFAAQLIIAFGVVTELPLVVAILAALGLVTPQFLTRHRRYAIVISAVVAAFLTPPDALSMLMMLVPLLLLYEISIFCAWVAVRRRARRAAATGPAALALLVCCAAAGRLAAQQPPPRPRPPAAPAVRGDTLRPGAAPTGRTIDTASARKLGLPTGPTRSFPPSDAVIDSLLKRTGFRITRYVADTLVVEGDSQTILLRGAAFVDRDGTQLEADSVRYHEASCRLDATGDPRLFDQGTVLVGEGMRYDTCIRRGTVRDALTDFDQGGSTWYMRGDLAVDSGSTRLYGASSDVTTCDLPVPHYQFAARQMKWLNKNVMVARPAVLYIRDVPILWLPFIFQDVRPGRHSGILIPQLGFNDLVRPTRSYNRQITNIGYYWAPNDFIDVTGRLDWFANRYVQFGIAGQYRWLNRFVSGTLGYNRQHQIGGSRGTTLRWDHHQTFNLSTSLNFNLNYASNTAVVRRNAIDPLQNTQQITSSLNFSKRYNWGTVTLGGNRRQSLSDGSVQQLLPALTVSPAPIALGGSITWSPGLSFTNNTTSKTPILPNLLQVLPGGVIDTIPLTGSSRVTALNFDTPIRFGSFNWQNSVRATDEIRRGRETVTPFRVPDLSTPDPTDSLLVSQVFTGDFESTVDWSTGINLPVLFRGSWKLQPVVGISNTTSGPFAIRNRTTGGDWVQQGKRFRFGATAAPTIFAFFPGFGPLSRIRHSVSPVITWNYEPAADVPEEFARAIALPGQNPELRSDATQRVSVSLSQTFEGKGRPPEGDTAGVNVRKLRLLSISTSGVTYDFEQAKKPGRTGWTTQTLSNSLLSDLLPGFNLNLTHDLWQGTAGVDTARFDPFLTSVSANFSVSWNTFRAIGSIFGLGGKDEAGTAKPGKEEVPAGYVADIGRRSRPGSFFSSSQAPLRRGRSFSASFNYTLSRTRPPVGSPTPVTTPRDRQSLGISTSFSPTPFWSLSWSSQYNITDSKFESQVVRLERDLHEWRAGFNFTRNANGNFAFYFSIYLTDLPDLKFDYDQTTFED